MSDRKFFEQISHFCLNTEILYLVISNWNVIDKKRKISFWNVNPDYCVFRNT